MLALDRQYEIVILVGPDDFRHQVAKTTTSTLGNMNKRTPTAAFLGSPMPGPERLPLVRDLGYHLGHAV
jgi:hypothetical protein